MAVTREQFFEWLKAAGGSDAKLRQDAERRLAMLPRTFILEHLPSLWKETEKKRQQTHKVSCILAGLYIAFFLFFPISHLFLRKFQLDFKFPSPFFFMFIGPLVSSLLICKPECAGMLSVLIQHQYPELVPLLIEALPVVRKANSGLTTASGPRVCEIMQVLSVLLPRYAARDLPDLNEPQEQILRKELHRYHKKLRNTDLILTKEESAFLAAALTFLRRKRQKKEDDQVAKAVENLATEHMDPTHESRERRQVREAARQAIVRLYG